MLNEPEGTCWFHSEAAEARRKAASARGGSTPSGSEGARAVRQRLASLYKGVASGELSSGVGSVLVQISNAELRSLQIERELAHGDELAARLERLEDVAHEAERGGGT